MKVRTPYRPLALFAWQRDNARSTALGASDDLRLLFGPKLYASSVANPLSSVRRNCGCSFTS
jgi:hypothetical protein